VGDTQPGTHPQAPRGRASLPGRAALPDARELLAAAVERLRRVAGCDAALAWARSADGRAYLAAAAYAGAAPREPEPGELELLAELLGAADLGGRAELRRIAAGHRCAAAAPVRGADGVCLAALLIGGSAPPRPRVLAALEAAARRLAAPLAIALRLERLDAEARRLDRLAALGSLAAEIAHEVRNPLASLKTFVQLAPERRDDPEFLGRFGAVVADELRRVERLLDLMIDQGRPGDAPGPGAAPLDAAVEAVADLLRLRAAQRGVRLETRVEPELPDAALSADALRQVVLNLALNALAATPPGGGVQVVAGARDAGLLLCVGDEGPGVAPALRATLFDPFASVRSERPGGLGLAITRRLVEEAGGSIECADRSGGGAEFRVRLPMAPASAPPRG
jgi:signal transduction histidine kinase